MKVFFLCEAKYPEIQTKMQYAITTIGYLLEKWLRITFAVKEMHYTQDGAEAQYTSQIRFTLSDQKNDSKMCWEM